MTHDPNGWAVLGRTIRDDRERQGLTREELAQRVKARGQQVTARSIGTLEEGPPPKRGAKRPTLEPTVAALGWQPGWTDRILAGEDPSAVLRREAPPRAEVIADTSPRAQLLEILPVVYQFSRTAAAFGAAPELRDSFDRLAQQLLDSVSATRMSQRDLGLAAYRPHAEGEGVPADDAARIRDALKGNA